MSGTLMAQAHNQSSNLSSFLCHNGILGNKSSSNTVAVIISTTVDSVWV